jgi:hypothetical protein
MKTFSKIFIGVLAVVALAFAVAPEEASAGGRTCGAYCYGGTTFGSSYGGTSYGGNYGSNNYGSNYGSTNYNSSYNNNSYQAYQQPQQYQPVCYQSCGNPCQLSCYTYQPPTPTYYCGCGYTTNYGPYPTNAFYQPTYQGGYGSGQQVPGWSGSQYYGSGYNYNNYTYYGSNGGSGGGRSYYGN